MMLKEYICMSLRDLWRRKGRTILTALGITIGTILIVSMVGIGNGVKGFMNDVVNDQDNARQISVNPYKYLSEEEQDEIDPMTLQDEYTHSIDDKFIEELQKTNKIENIIATLGGSADYIKYNGKEYKGSISFTAYSKDTVIYSDNNIKEVRNSKDDDSLKPLIEGDMVTNKDSEIMIGENILSKMDVTPADAVGKEIELFVKNYQTQQLQSKKFKIAGVIGGNFQNGDGIIMSINDTSELLSIMYVEKDYFKAHGYEHATVITSDISDVEDVSNKIKDLDYIYTSSIDMAKEINKDFEGINTAFSALGVVVLIVSAIGIVNTMTMAVMERTKSIGVMKSVGANRGAIRTMFLVQSALIGAIGGGVGILLGCGINAIVQLIANALVKSENISSTIAVGLPWYYLLVILAFSIILALISGIYPAIKASKLDPIEALRR